MSGGVYALPVHLLAGVYCDISGEEGGLIGFKFEKSATKRFGKMVYDFCVEMDCPSDRAPNGRIKLRAPSGLCSDGAEAERLAVMVAIDLLRTEFGIYPADFNYIMISEKRQLYSAMRTTIGLFRNKYDELDGIMQGCHKELDKLCNAVTAWVGCSYVGVDGADIGAACGFVASLRDIYVSDAASTEHARDLVGILLKRDNRSEAEIDFDRSVPQPMVIDWAGSFYLLRTIFSEAVKKFNCEVEDFAVVKRRDGRFKASLSIPVAPFKFHGGVDESEFGARSKLMFAVLKHVNTRMGYPIFDLHYQVRLFQDVYVQRFDHKMENIYHCGLKLHGMHQACQERFAAAVQHVTGTLDPTDACAVLISSVQEAVIKMRELRDKFGAVWDAFENARVNEEGLRARIAGNV